MRRVLSLVAVGFVLQAVGAQGQSPAYDTSVTANDRLAAALWRIAASTNTRIGFEATDHTRHFLKQIPALPVSTLEDALNAAVGADDRYEWRRIHDFVIVRPKGAWDDPSDPFNRQIRPVHIENATPLGVLQRVRNFIYTDQFVPDRPQSDGDPVSFELSSGSAIDVLNKLMAAADQVFWIGSYRPVGRRAEHYPRWDLSLEVLGREFVVAFTGSGPENPKGTDRSSVRRNP
jgi:hypothetical protein